MKLSKRLFVVLASILTFTIIASISFAGRPTMNNWGWTNPSTLKQVVIEETTDGKGACRMVTDKKVMQNTNDTFAVFIDNVPGQHICQMAQKALETGKTVQFRVNYKNEEQISYTYKSNASSTLRYNAPVAIAINK